MTFYMDMANALNIVLFYEFVGKPFPYLMWPMKGDGLRKHAVLDVEVMASLGMVELVTSLEKPSM